MEEGENDAQYFSRLKDVFNAIRGATTKIDYDIVLSKELRALLPIYDIRVSTIQELRFIRGYNLTLEGLVGRLTTLELSNFVNFKPKNVGSTFKAKISLNNIKRRRKR
jgi:hypothetical protein